MASLLSRRGSRLTGSDPKYEPLPRYWHNSYSVGIKVVIEGGRTKDFSEKSRQHLSSVIEIFDPYSELWEQRQVTGDAPSPGTYGAASASLHDDLFSFGGSDGRGRINTIHKLDIEKLCWSQVSPQDAEGAPMAKTGCEMIAFGNSLGMFGGFGVPRGPMEPQSFIKDTRSTDGRGWTNEFHIYNLSEGVWSCPATTGDRPPPCSGLTFTAVDDRRAVLFGGFNGQQGRMNDVFIIDLSTTNWRKLNKSGDGLWPEERIHHAACCLNYGQQFPQLLVSGGLDKQNKPLADLWILDIERENWKKVGVTLKAQWDHSLTAFSLGPGLTEVVKFGGSPEPPTGSDETQPKMANTTPLQFRVVKSSGEYQWELLSLVDNTQHGSQQRMIEKVQCSQQSSDDIERTRMERLQLQEERDRARKEMSKIKEESEKEKHRITELEELMKKEKENIKRTEDERDRALLEKSQAEKELMQALNAKVKDAERMITTANQEIDRALEAKKESELQQKLLSIEKAGVEERARELKRERDEARVEVQKEKEKSVQERNRLEERTKFLKRERDSAIEHKKQADYEIKRAMKQVELGKREAERLITKGREEYNRIVSEKEKIEIRCKFLEEENDRAKEEIEKGRHETQKAEMLMRKAENERATTLCKLEEAEKKLRVLEEQSLAETMQKSEIEGKYRMETQTAEVEIENLRQQLMSQTEKAIEAEKLAKVMEREKERLKADLENLETRAVVTEAKVSKNEAKKTQEIREREHSIPEEREEESKRSDEERDELEELKKEHKIMRMKLERAEIKANELQEKLEENEKKEHEKMRAVAKLVHQERSLEMNTDEREKDEVVAEKTVKVTNEEQDIVWEGYGLRLHIPPNSLPEDCSELQLNMTVSRPRDCELPDEDGVLVSAVYSFSHNLGETKLRQKAILEMQHCTQGSYTPLCIVQSDNIVPPHRFQTLQGGKFDSSDRYASIELDHFCSFGVYLAWYTSRNLKTCASLYYTNIKSDSFHFYLYIVPHLDAILKEIANDVASMDNDYKCITTSRFEFQEDSQYIHLVLPKDPVSGWIMKHLNSEKMKKNDAIIMHWGVPLIPFHVEVSWTGDLPPAKLAYDTVIEGAEDHHITIISPHTIGCRALGSTTGSTKTHVQPQDEKPTLPQLLEMDMPSRVTDCFRFGTLLLCDKYGNKMSIISENCQGSPVRMTTEVLKEWLEGKGVEVSWDTLILTLKKCKLSVLAYEVQTALQQL